MISLGIANVVKDVQMINTSAPIVLRDGSIVVSEQWKIGDCADALHRPANAVERNLRRIENSPRGHYESATNPSPSQYLNGWDYSRMMKVLELGKAKFDEVKGIVDAVRSQEGAAALREYISARLMAGSSNSI